VEKTRSAIDDFEVTETRDALKLKFVLDYKHPDLGNLRHVVYIVFHEDPLYKAPDTLIYRVEKGGLLKDIAYELPCHVRNGKPCVMSDETWVSLAIPYPDGPIVFSLLQIASFIKDFYEEDEKSFCSKSIF
jgi:hypothetical protein